MTIQITQEFQAALNLIQRGSNVFITGRAGTGKSTLLREVLSREPDRNVLLTAPTGVAALNINGYTIHRSFGFRPGMYPDDLVEGGKWRLGGERARVLRLIDMLVVDEISMVRADIFDMMNVALQRLRENNLPFGGVQLVLVGDMLQLPPVVSTNEKDIFESIWEGPYFYNAHCFDDIDLQQISLEHIWRQSDGLFIDILNQVREGNVSQQAIDILNSRVRRDLTDMDEWITLTSRKKVVDRINREKLAILPTTRFRSTAFRVGNTNGYSYPATDELEYARGARVMMVVNDPAGRFVNGSLGEVIDASDQEISVLLDHSGQSVTVGKHTWEIGRPVIVDGRITNEPIGKITQFPVILAWAMTIHKSQGKTLPKCIIDLTAGTSTEGQFYVALSRAVSLDNLYFTEPVTREHIRANSSLLFQAHSYTSPTEETDRRVFVSFNGVSTESSDRVARVHVIVTEGDDEVAEFGSWINPLTELGDFGSKYGVPADGLSMAPTLDDFWPLFSRQAEGGIVIADNLSLLERAARHQLNGVPLALGRGHDILDLGIEPDGDTTVERCRSMAHAYYAGALDDHDGVPAPKAEKDSEGAVFIPSWAPAATMMLDPTRATDSDIAWAAMSGGEDKPVSDDEIRECVELMSTWAMSRGSWTKNDARDLRHRVSSIRDIRVDMPDPVERSTAQATTIAPGTRIAFDGVTTMNGQQVTHMALSKICAHHGFVYTPFVAKRTCNLLVTGPSSESNRERVKARRLGIPLMPQAEFESALVSMDEQPDPTITPVVPPEETPVRHATRTFVEPSRLDTLLTEGTQVSFRGSTFIDGVLYPQGEALQELCSQLGLRYKQAVTKTRCDYLVSDSLEAEDVKSTLARKFDIPVIHTNDFATWASDQLADSMVDVLDDETNLDAPPGTTEAPTPVEDEAEPTPPSLPWQERVTETLDSDEPEESDGIDQQATDEFKQPPAKPTPRILNEPRKRGRHRKPDAAPLEELEQEGLAIAEVDAANVKLARTRKTGEKLILIAFLSFVATLFLAGANLTTPGVIAFGTCLATGSIGFIKYIQYFLGRMRLRRQTKRN